MALYKGSQKVAGSAGAGFSPENTGTTGQVLTKTSTGYNYQDVPSELPSSGTNGQYLQKTANGPVWAAVEALPSGGTTGNFLKKTSNGSERGTETVSSGDSGTSYVIKVSNSEPASGTANNVITIVTD